MYAAAAADADGDDGAYAGCKLDEAYFISIMRSR